AVVADAASLKQPPRAVTMWGIGCRAMPSCGRWVRDRAAYHPRVAPGARRRGPRSIWGEHGSPRRGSRAEGLTRTCSAPTPAGCTTGPQFGVALCGCLLLGLG